MNCPPARKPEATPMAAAAAQKPGINHKSQNKL